MATVIDLCSSSPKRPDSVEKKNLARGRITTPEFQAFRERWLTLHDGLCNKSNSSSPRIIQNDFVEQSSDIILLNNNNDDGDCLIHINSQPRTPVTNVKRVRITRGNYSRSSPPTITSRFLPTKNLQITLQEKLSVRPEDSRPLFSSRLATSTPRNKAESLGEVTMLVDSNLFSRHSTIFSALQMRILLLSTDLPFNNCITWKRLPFDGSGECDCPFILLIFDAQEIHREIRSGAREDINNFINQRKDLIPDDSARFYFLVWGGKQVAQKINTEINRQLRNCITTGKRLRLTPTKTLPTWSELEQRLWLRGMELGIHFQFLSKLEDLEEHLLELTKCVAWTPYAHRYNNHNFCTTINKASGKTLDDTWSLILQEIDRVTPTIANSITRCYPTVSSLLSKFETLPVEAADNLLANIPIDDRRVIGPSLSKRIHRVLTASLLDPDERFVL